MIILLKNERLALKFELIIHLSKVKENWSQKFDKFKMLIFSKFSLYANRLHYIANRFAPCIFPKIVQNSLCAIDCTLGAIDCTVKKIKKKFNSFSLQIEILGK